MEDVAYVSVYSEFETIYTMAVKTDGSLWAWGDNRYGQLGDGTTQRRTKPVRVMEDVASVMPCGLFTMAIKTDGSLWAWGGTLYFYGDDVFDRGTLRTTPVKIMDDAAMLSYGAVVKTDGSLWVWEYTQATQPVPFGPPGDEMPAPVKVMDNVAAVSASYQNIAAVTTDGELWTWGWVAAMVLDDSNTYPRDYSIRYKVTDGVKLSAARPVLPPSPVKAVSAGSHTAVVKEDGSLWIWGYNPGGWLDGSTDRYLLTHVKMMNDVAAVAAGAYSTFALKKDGSLWAWGMNNCGQLGDGTVTHNTKPARILDDVVAIAAGEFHIAALKADGSLWTWGDNCVGQLGDGTTEDRLFPVKVMEGVKTMSAGALGTAAVKTDGSVWVWGRTALPGEDMYQDIQTPVKVFEGAVTVSASEFHTMVIKTDGSLWAWGSNICGELGDGTTESRADPVRIMEDVASVATRWYFTMAVRTDGSLWAWGRNENNILGDGTETNRIEPVKIMDDVAFLSAGPFHTMAVKTDGSLWAWGSSRLAAFGDVTFTSSKVPVMVLDGKGLPRPSEPPEPPVERVAKPISATVLVNGKPVEFDAFNIEGNNYFKLRDIAYVLNDTEKQFNLNWDADYSIIDINSDTPYTPVGNEMADKYTENKVAKPTSSTIYMLHTEVTFTAYNIGGNNYFKLRDIGEAFDFFLGWDGETKTITVDTGRRYEP